MACTRGPKAPADTPTGSSARVASPQAGQTQPVQLVLRDDRFDRWDLRHLMPLGLGILALQRVLAAAAPLGLDRDHDIDLLNRHQRPCLALVAGLPAGPTATGVATGPFRGGLRRIARRRPGGGARVLLQPLGQVLNRRFQALDGGLQRRHACFERTDVVLDGSRDLLPQL